jgi:GNAT superfamily N-acetyltransferase
MRRGAPPAVTERPRIIYAREPGLDVSEFRRILIASGLGSSRPVEDEARLAAMLTAADLILTARFEQPGGPLVGVARCITDFAWCCYLSELAIAPSAQGFGIGKGLLDEARRQLGPAVTLLLVSVPEAAGFYERAGMAQIPDAFWYRREH